MAICFELEELGLRKSEKHLSSLIKVNREEAKKSTSPVVAILSKKRI